MVGTVGGNYRCVMGVFGSHYSTVFGSLCSRDLGNLKMSRPQKTVSNTHFANHLQQKSEGGGRPDDSDN
jgi:hypothetical protein